MFFILQICTHQYCDEKTSPRQMEFDTGVNGYANALKSWLRSNDCFWQISQGQQNCRKC